VNNYRSVYDLIETTSTIPLKMFEIIDLAQILVNRWEKFITAQTGTGK
jgi:hypothetical protein